MPHVQGPLGQARTLASAAYRQGVAALQHLDPTRLLLSGASPSGTVLLACVYRRPGIEVVRALLRQLPADAAVRLWSLDGDVPPDLAPVTAGIGAGSRSALLNRLVDGADPDLLVLADDDVRFVIGDLRQLLAVGQRLQLDLFQPAHLASSHANFDFVRRRSGTFARVTEFVEQGPLVVVTRAGRQVVLPLPDDAGMAWGVEAEWSARARERQLRLGVVDAVAMRHLSPAAGAYDRESAEAALAARLATHGLTSLEQLHVVRRRYGLLPTLRTRR